MKDQTTNIEPIVLATDDELLSMEFFRALARRVKELDRSRLGTTAWLDEKLFCWPGDIFNADGTELILYEDIVDEAYGWEESFSWNTNVKVFAERPPKRRPNRAILLRLKLWDAAFKIDADPICLPIE
ncbi:MAG: hypothetical protein ACJA0K_000664 [Maricaulis maris]|jgi:hypothetical protein